MSSLRGSAWAWFDQIVATAPLRNTNPWVREDDGGVRFEPDYDTLCRLLGVPALLQATSQSGVPALALDVWVSYELRRAGFDPDRVWPRPVAPRACPGRSSTSSLRCRPGNGPNSPLGSACAAPAVRRRRTSWARTTSSRSTS